MKVVTTLLSTLYSLLSVEHHIVRDATYFEVVYRGAYVGFEESEVRWADHKEVGVALVDAFRSVVYILHIVKVVREPRL